MGTMLDYLKWRGDLEFWQDGFNEVDNIFLSYLAYVSLDEVFDDTECEVLTLKAASDCFFAIYDDEYLASDKSFIKDAPYVMRAMAASKRYRSLHIRNYVNHINIEENLQFSAMEVLLPDGTSYVAYRGTDDRIIGWKEDFLLSSMEVGAQKESVEYLNMVGSNCRRKLHVGGHSKGGHLAVFAAACCAADIQNRIIDVYSNDGPGFLEDFAAGEQLRAIAPKIRRIIPEESVFGTLFEHITEPIVIKSIEKNVMQHNPLSWEIECNQFIRTESLSQAAQIVDKTMKNWIGSFDDEEKIAFINDFFSVLEAPGVETLTELQNGGIKTMQIMVKQMNTLTPETKEKLNEMLKGYFTTWTEVISENGIFKFLKRRNNAKIKGTK